MKIIKTKVPVGSKLNNKTNNNYTDCYQGDLINPENTISACEITKVFFSSEPYWVTKLFILRNKIVSLFGLKTANKINQKEKFTCKVNEQIGLFKIFFIADNEVIIGQDDTHLNFRVSLFKHTIANKKHLSITTSVTFNHWLGKLYFLIISPFHKIIVPIMLNLTIKNLEKQHHTTPL